MMNKTILMLGTAFLLIGCGAVTKAIDDSINGETTVADIKAKDKVIIINDMDSISCAIIASGIKDKYPNGKPFVTDNGTTCATFDKSTSTDCKAQTLSELKQDYPDNANIQNVKEGTKACVVGGDKPAAN